MKKLLPWIALAGLSFGATALGQDRHRSDDQPAPVRVNRGAPSNAVAPAAPRHVITRTQPQTQRYISRAPFRQRTYVTEPNVNAGASVRYANDRNRARDYSAPGTRAGFHRDRNVVTTGRTGNAVVTNNWRSSQFSGRNYAAFRDYHRQWHDRDWWRHHYDRIVFVDGGWWYWDAGYWFPAWGYDPYAYYPYDGPIYGYADLTPQQVVTEVQAQLQADGYYAGPVDGILGPMTRAAIAAYQADHGLAVTSTVDEPTVASLGIV